jgi:hypothetical protein
MDHIDADPRPAGLRGPLLQYHERVDRSLENLLADCGAPIRLEPALQQRLRDRVRIVPAASPKHNPLRATCTSS